MSVVWNLELLLIQVSLKLEQLQFVMTRLSEQFSRVTLTLRPFVAELRASIRLAVPLIGSQVAQSINGFVDTVMMGRLSSEALAAGGLAATTFATLLVTASGVLMAVSPLVSEAHGKGNVTGIRQTTRQGLWLSLLLSIPVMLLLANTEALMATLGQNATTVTLSKSYLDVMRWGTLPALLLAMLKGAVSSVSQTRPILAIAAGGTIFNVVGNYALGLGHFGFPVMGLAGIALVSNLSYSGMLVSLVLYTFYSRRLRTYKLLHRWYRFELTPFVSLLWLGVPIGMSAALEIGLYATTAYLMGTFGTEALAAYQIVIQTIVILFMVPIGIGQAVTIRVGRWHGQQNLAGIRQAATVGIYIGAAFMGLTALLLLCFPKGLISLYLDINSPANASVVSLATTMLAISAFSQFFDGIQTTAAGALRGLQDTRIPMLLSFLSFWAIGLTTGCVLGFSLGFGSAGLWVGQSIGVFTAALSFVWRLRRLVSELAY